MPPITIVFLFGFLRVLEASLCLSYPRCYCSTKKDIKILCKNVSHLSPIEELLERYPRIYSLRIYGEKLTQLASRSFPGKAITVLEINAPLLNISKDSLSEIHDLQIVNFDGGQFPHVPEAFSNTTIKTIQLVRGTLTRIDGQLQNNSETTDILLNENRIAYISSDAFLNAVSLQTLNLFNNRISYLDPAVFESLTQLKSIDLSFNFLSSVDGCFKNLNPLEINLYGNNLSNVDEAFHRSMWSVKSLDLGGNPHLNISASTFDGTLQSLQILSLNNNDFEDFNPLILKNFRSLHRLNLNGNRLSVLPRDFLTSLRTPFLSILELADNNLDSTEALFPLDYQSEAIHNLQTSPQDDYKFKSSFLRGNSVDYLSLLDYQQPFNHQLKTDSLDGDILESSQLEVDSIIPQFPLDYQRSAVHTLKTVRLDGNKIKSLQLGGSFKSVLHLDLGRNEVQKLGSTDFENLTSVSNLNLSGNPLSEVDSGCFRHQKRLRTLDLSFTDLKSLNLSIRNLSSLENLRVDSSLLISLEEDELDGLMDLEALSVRNNSLSSVHGVLKNLSSLMSLDISDNNLTTLTLNSLPLNVQGLVNLKKLWMEGNPWSCDCRLSWLLDWLGTKGSHLEDDPKCRSPPHLNGSSLRSLNMTDLQIWRGDDCPSECDCNCVPAEKNFYNLVNCSSRYLRHIPKIFPDNTLRIDLHDNRIESMESFVSNSYRNLQVLDMEDNNLVEVPLSKLPNSLQSLKLAGNKVSRFPFQEWNYEYTVTMTLSRNPWICDCEAWHFRQWLLSHNNTVEDLNEVRCTNGGPLNNNVIIHLTYGDMCVNFNYNIVIAVVVVLLAGVCIGAFAFRKVLIVLCYSSGCRSLKAEEKHLHHFDVFLLFADEDEEIALGSLAEGMDLEVTIYPTTNTTSQIAGLEAEGYKLFIPTRNVFLNSSPVNIESTLMECCKVVVLLTKDFLKSVQCMQLLKASMSCSITSTSERMIFVTNIDNDFLKESDPVLSAVLKKSIQLRRDELFFWKKLKYHMPKKRERRIIADEENEPFLQQGNVE